MAIHITEADVANDPRTVLERVQARAQVVVEANHRPIAVTRAPRPQRATVAGRWDNTRR
ncbi:MAG TPA: hypothetical protein VJM31_09685 [Vicinamibacterales bacterium]|nr:hypothetical protein [Vicinamibacterales bacterium]